MGGTAPPSRSKQQAEWPVDPDVEWPTDGPAWWDEVDPPCEDQPDDIREGHGPAV